MIQYIKEPTDLQCGQAVIAMAAGINVDEVIAFLGNDRETDLKEMRRAFEHWGIKMSPSRVQVKDKSQLPSMCLLSLETPRCWHWSLYADGTFYDPEHGVMSDFPVSNRKYFWELTAL
ncbi:MAG: hypothetical protein IJ561_03505 [Ruminococcus sp.]|nr:hypothetical protein [Ruminococcus sp.]